MNNFDIQKKVLEKVNISLWETVYEIIYWSIKMTHEGIRWHVSAWSWPFIFKLISVQTFSLFFVVLFCIDEMLFVYFFCVCLSRNIEQLSHASSDQLLDD